MTSKASMEHDPMPVKYEDESGRLEEKASSHSRSSSEDSKNTDQPQTSTPSSQKSRKSGDRPRRSSTSRGGSSGGEDVSEQGKKSRREAANSNERRRMMSINNGFMNLQMLLPKHYVKRGEKMSKAAVLHSTVDYINKLLQDHNDLQGQNKNLVQKGNSTRLDNDGESTDGAESESSGAKDLSMLVEHWKAKYARERQLRAQTIEEFRRIIVDAIECCPSGFSKRDTYNAALLRRSKSPTPGNDTDFPVLSSQFKQISGTPKACPTSVGVKRENDFVVPTIKPENARPVVTTLSMNQDMDGAIISIPDQLAAGANKRKSATEAENARKNLKPLTGFDILYQAITFSENLDGSVGVCGQDNMILQAAPEPPCKKRRK